MRCSTFRLHHVQAQGFLIPCTFQDTVWLDFSSLPTPVSPRWSCFAFSSSFLTSINVESLRANCTELWCFAHSRHRFEGCSPKFHFHCSFPGRKIFLCSVSSDSDDGQLLRGNRAAEQGTKTKHHPICDNQVPLSNRWKCQRPPITPNRVFEIDRLHEREGRIEGLDGRGTMSASHSAKGRRSSSADASTWQRS